MTIDIVIKQKKNKSFSIRKYLYKADAQKHIKAKVCTSNNKFSDQKSQRKKSMKQWRKEREKLNYGEEYIEHCDIPIIKEREIMQNKEEMLKME